MKPSFTMVRMASHDAPVVDCALLLFQDPEAGVEDLVKGNKGLGYNKET
jgi:hypothetical protein